jgi:DNA-binding IclR family transcriptional regulator
VAALAQTREQGYALDSEENEQGVRCVAVPVWNHESRVIAALSLSTLTSAWTTPSWLLPRAASAGRARAVTRAGLPGLSR